MTEVFAFDSHPDAYVRLAERGDVISAVRGSFVDLADHGPFDNIVCSSVLHEVYSYPRFDITHWDAWCQAIDVCVRALAPGGRLIIRDGVKPDKPLERVELTIPDEQLMWEYLHLNPHTYLGLSQQGPGQWSGTKDAVAAALCTLTWGRDSLPREALERYQLDTLDGYAQRVCRRGLSLATSYSYLQQGYIDHLVGYEATVAGPNGTHTPWFPDTNAVWVFEKK